MGTPLLGSALDFRRDALAVYMRAMQEYGDVVRWRLGPPVLGMDAYGVFHPEGVRHVLSAQAPYERSGRLISELQAMIGGGLLTSNGDEWLWQRRTLQPLFTQKQAQTYATVIREEADALIERWRPDAAVGRPVELHAEMTRCALTILCRTMFGEAVDEALPVIGRFLPLASAWILRRGTAPIPLPARLPTRTGRRTRAAQSAAFHLVDRLIARGPTADGRDTLLDLLHGVRHEQTGQALDPAAMRDQALVFLTAGQETTATALVFTLHLLAQHPETQQQVREEADAVLDGVLAGAAGVDALSFTRMVVKEALRLYPTVYALSRSAVADDVIEGHPIPAGALVLLSPWATHRHRDFWPEPDRFDPDRFTAPAEASRHRYAWFPFGGGPRACIGVHMSMLEMLIVTAAVTRAYTLACPDERLPLSAETTLRPAGRVPC
ncbi:MAG: cytochrome P450, partial [Pseudonocardiales bacterium]